MSAFYDLASLVLVPSGYKASKVYAQKPLTTDGQLTFSRASTATRVNSAGLIETVSSNVPRLDYLGSTCPKLQLEAQRTNNLVRSSEFDNAAWLPQNLSTSANATTAPDGTTSADKLIPTASNALHHTFQAQIAIGGAAYSTFFVKAAEYTKVAIREAWNGTNWASFNLSTGAIITQASGSNATIVNYGNGWYRIGIYSADTTQRHDLYVLNNAYTNTDPSAYNYAGDGTSGIFAWGAQFEAGAYATSYIPTTTAAVTRLADACSKTGISSLIGQTEGAMFVDVNLDTRQHFSYFVIAPDATSATNYLGFFISNATIAFESVVGSALQAAINLSNFATGRFKIAAAYKENDFVLYVNGTQVGTDTSGSVPACSQVGLYQYNQTQPLKYNQALLFKTRLTNAQLAELTTL